MESGANLERRVNLQPSDSYATIGGQSNYLTRSAVEAKMVQPVIRTGVKQRNTATFNFIPTVYCIGLMQIAGFACKGRVLSNGVATGCARKYMLDLKTEVEYLLWCMPILTATSGAIHDDRIERIHVFTSGNVRVLLIEASNDASTNCSNS